MWCSLYYRAEFPDGKGKNLSFHIMRKTENYMGFYRENRWLLEVIEGEMTKDYTGLQNKVGYPVFDSQWSWVGCGSLWILHISQVLALLPFERVLLF